MVFVISAIPGIVFFLVTLWIINERERRLREIEADAIIRKLSASTDSSVVYLSGYYYCPYIPLLKHPPLLT